MAWKRAGVSGNGALRVAAPPRWRTRAQRRPTYPRVRRCSLRTRRLPRVKQFCFVGSYPGAQTEMLWRQADDIRLCSSGWMSGCQVERPDPTGRVYAHKFYLFIYLFLAVLGLHFRARAFSSCGERGPLFIAVRGPLTIAASLVAEHRLQTRRLSSCGSRA